VAEKRDFESGNEGAGMERKEKEGVSGWSGK